MNNHRFGIGQFVTFGTMTMIVVDYVKSLLFEDQWEVCFKDNKTGKIAQVPCYELENV